MSNAIYGYIYLTTNKINGKKYIGQHKGVSLDPNYFGSGKLILAAIEKYGKNNFECSILDIAYTDDELNQKEIYYIKKFNAVKSDMYYNLVEDSRGSHTVSDETKQMLSNMNVGRKASEETRAKLRKVQKGKKCGDANPAKRLDVRMKLKLVNHGCNNPAYGKHWFTNGVETIYAYECPEGYYPGRGKHKTNRSKIVGRHWYNDGVHQIMSYTCPEGYVEGRLA